MKDVEGTDIDLKIIDFKGKILFVEDCALCLT